MNHNEIVLQLNNETLALLLHNEFGKKGNWSRFHWVHQKKLIMWLDNELTQLITTFGDKYPATEDTKISFSLASNYIDTIPIHQSLKIEKTFEYPIIKGEGQYMCTKGFIDLIVHCKPITSVAFSTYKWGCTKAFLIEIKTENDFKDFGAILRQIKEYREYYNNGQIKKWQSSLGTPYSTRFCVLSTFIQPNIQDIFKNEGILCLELDSLNQEKFD